MSFFIFLFYSILFILIKVGDFVNSAWRFIIRIITSPLFFLKRRLSVPKKAKTSKRKTIRLNRIFNFDLFSKLSMHTTPNNKRKRVGRKPKAISTNFFVLRMKYLLFGAIFASIFIFLPLLFVIFISDLPKLSNLSVSYISKTTKIMDRNGKLLFEIYANQNRTIVSLDQIPKNLINATVAIEDKDFFKHKGFDMRGIARAIYVDLTKKDFQGGSTITQQLIKSALLTPELTITRKAKELTLAFWAEQQYTKDQILELYFNYIPYGGTAWGVEAASQIYFGKKVEDLSLAQSAYLAGLPQAPSAYSPFAGDGTLGKVRQKDVLDAMVSEKYITRDQAAKAFKEKLVFKSPQVPIKAPHFVMYVKDLLVKKYGLLEVERGGLQVTTSLDVDTQNLAEGVVSEEVNNSGYLGIGNGAALVTNPQNGDVLAMVGSRDYFDLEKDGNVNITTSLRQPGSTIKVVTYSLALSKGLTEATLLEDSPLTITSQGAEPYRPVNYDGKFHGRVPLRLAFANSYNIPAVRLAQRFGVGQIVDFGRKMGITNWKDPSKYGVSITLGGAEVTMLDLATVYGTVANEGERVNLEPILKITNSEGKVLEEKKVEGEKVIDPGVAFIVSDILSDNRARSLSFGPNSPLVIPNHKVSVKTGTTDNKRDNWTVGYTPNLLVAAWVGNNDNTPLSQALASGITGAAPIWNKIMVPLVEKTQDPGISVPSDVIARQCFGYNAYFILGTDTKDPCRYSPPTPTFQQQ
jgi:1A family penicillin-binding protein